MPYSSHIVPALLEFLYEWMLLHFIHDIAALVCEETQSGLYKVSDCDHILHLPCGSEPKMTSSQSLYSVEIFIAVRFLIKPKFALARGFRLIWRNFKVAKL